ncbi:MAG TPA: LuxR C-terminal-related transcriptional regulator [Actinomycetota bacterium]|nr:LuxR C-terminal-related transcriptional regulator [Actinomycetota bacterium]
MAEPTANIDRARAAVKRKAWSEAYETFLVLEPSGLTPDDWDGYADAAWWTGRIGESISARQKAYTGFAEAGDDRRAAATAARLCIEHFLRDEQAAGAGWFARAQRHASELPDCVELGFAAYLEATVLLFTGDPVSAVPLVTRAIEIGRRFGDRDLLGMAIHTQGLILIAQGGSAEGVALLDEAMTSVVAGEVSDYFTGAIYCNVIGACLEIADVRRAAEWGEAARRWSESIPPESRYPGMCRLNRAQIASLRGAWSEAEAESVRATEELMEFSPPMAAEALYETGDVRRRRGDLAGAEEAFERAHELGFEPQPGLALLRLAQGRADAALTALRMAVMGASGNRLRRARLQWALAETALAAGDLASAAAAADELDTLAGGSDARVLAAFAATVRGSLLLAQGDVPGAVAGLRRASALWQELRLPYELARTRLLFGLTLRAAGDEEGARLELRAALGAFERLGAPGDAARASDLLGGPAALPGGLTAREAEVLRLVASGKTNRDIAVELVISEHTVARHLQNMFAKLGVTSRSAATAYAYEHDLA